MATAKSDRLKEKYEKEDYALPPPLQKSENKKIVANRTPVKRSMEEEELDKQLKLIEKSICETESQLQEVGHQKKFKEKKAKLERLQKQLSRNERYSKRQKKVRFPSQKLKKQLSVQQTNVIKTCLTFKLKI